MKKLSTLDFIFSGPFVIPAMYSIMTAAAFLLISGCSIFQQNSGIDLERHIARQQARQELASESSVKKKMSAAEYENIGDSHLAKGDMNRAYYFYVKGLAEEPDNISLLHKKGRLLLKKKRFVEAQPVYSKLLANDGRDPKALEGLARVYFGQGNFTEAKQYFTEALTFLPDLYLAHEHLGLIYSREKQFKKAISRFESAHYFQPDNVSIGNNLAVTYYLNGDYKAAVRLFSKLTKVSNDQKIYNNLALAYFQLGLFDKAIGAFKKGAEHEAIAYNNMGYEFLKNDRHRRAIEAFQRAINLYPQYYPTAHKNLSIAKLALEDSTGKNSTQ